jgi:hypothetical protein
MSEVICTSIPRGLMRTTMGFSYGPIVSRLLDAATDSLARPVSLGPPGFRSLRKRTRTTAHPPGLHQYRTRNATLNMPFLAQTEIVCFPERWTNAASSNVLTCTSLTVREATGLSTFRSVPCITRRIGLIANTSSPCGT